MRDGAARPFFMLDVDDWVAINNSFFLRFLFAHGFSLALVGGCREPKPPAILLMQNSQTDLLPYGVLVEPGRYCKSTNVTVRPAASNAVVPGVNVVAPFVTTLM
jgi:hypothetical protein